MEKNLLIVDDSVFIYEEMKEMLEDTSYKIAGYAKSGEEALGLYEKLQPDVVTMDIILPGMDGMETSRRILNTWPEAKIVMVSSLAYDDTMEESEHTGAKGFLYKPFEKEVLVAALDKATTEEVIGESADTDETADAKETEAVEEALQEA